MVLKSIDTKYQKDQVLIFLIGLLEVTIKNNVTVISARPAVSNAWYRKMFILTEQFPEWSIHGAKTDSVSFAEQTRAVSRKPDWKRSKCLDRLCKSVGIGLSCKITVCHNGAKINIIDASLVCSGERPSRERNADAIAGTKKLIMPRAAHTLAPFVLAPGFMRECDCLAPRFYCPRSAPKSPDAPSPRLIC
jgi:hypothetical protein